MILDHKIWDNFLGYKLGNFWTFLENMLDFFQNKCICVDHFGYILLRIGLIYGNFGQKSWKFHRGSDASRSFSGHLRLVERSRQDMVWELLDDPTSGSPDFWTNIFELEYFRLKHHDHHDPKNLLRNRQQTLGCTKIPCVRSSRAAWLLSQLLKLLVPGRVAPGVRR